MKGVGSDEVVVRVGYDTVSTTLSKACAIITLFAFCPILWIAIPFAVMVIVSRHKAPQAVLTETWLHVEQGSIPLRDVLEVEYGTSALYPTPTLKVRGYGSEYRLTGLKDLDEFVADTRRLVEQARTARAIEISHKA